MIEESPVDIALLDENAELGLDDLRELIDMYFTQADEILAGLRTAINAGAAKDVGELAHKLAGSSAVCGMTAMMAPLRALERQGREGQLSDAKPLMAETTERLDLCRRMLDEYLAEKGG
jgi:HPt (histidine-containing phosphotransfer) domain-containing protein